MFIVHYYDYLGQHIYTEELQLYREFSRVYYNEFNGDWRKERR